MTVFLNGRLVADDEANIDPADRGLTLGDGLFETIAVRRRQGLRLDAHLARLRDGAEVIGLAVPLGGHELKSAFKDVIEANAIDFGVLRLTLTRGLGLRGLLPPVPAQPTLLITGTSQDLTPQEPVTAIIATTTRRNEHSPLSGIKSTSTLDSILAAREAAKRGAGDALLLNGAGNLAEATAANLFLVIDGSVVTPPIHDGAMPGVMRADVIKGLGALERTLGPADMPLASEAFLTNSLGIRSLSAVDGEPIGDGNPGPVTAAAQKIARG